MSRPGHRHRTSETPGPVYPWPQAKPEAGAFSDLIQAICKPLARYSACTWWFTVSLSSIYRPDRLHHPWASIHRAINSYSCCACWLHQPRASTHHAHYILQLQCMLANGCINNACINNGCINISSSVALCLRRLIMSGQGNTTCLHDNAQPAALLAQCSVTHHTVACAVMHCPVLHCCCCKSCA